MGDMDGKPTNLSIPDKFANLWGINHPMDFLQRQIHAGEPGDKYTYLAEKKYAIIFSSTFDSMPHKNLSVWSFIPYGDTLRIV
ncbi:MAG: hypothetical protein ABSA23_16870 [Anaerolineales bacterium]|jgi:hypothetical protein